MSVDESRLTPYQRGYIRKMRANTRGVRNLQVVSVHEESGAVKLRSSLRRRVGYRRWAWISGEITWVFPTPEARKAWFTPEAKEARNLAKEARGEAAWRWVSDDSLLGRYDATLDGHALSIRLERRRYGGSWRVWVDGVDVRLVGMTPEETKARAEQHVKSLGDLGPTQEQFEQALAEHDERKREEVNG